MKARTSFLVLFCTTVALDGTAEVTAAGFAPVVLSSSVSLQRLDKRQPSDLPVPNEVSIVGADVSFVSAEPSSNSNNPEITVANYVRRSRNLDVSWSEEIRMASSVFFGCLFTFILNNYSIAVIAGRPILASSIVGMMAALILPDEKWALAAFGGCFAGMASLAVIPGVSASAVLGLVSAVLMAVLDRQKILVGVGGRLGLIALLAGTAQFLLSSSSSFLDFVPQPAAGAKIIGAYPSPRILLSQILPTCISTAVGALLMSVWKETWKYQSKKAGGGKETAADRVLDRISTSVAAVSATGLALSPCPASVAGPAFCGSIIAMSSPAIIETYGGLIGASLMGGLCQVLMAGVFLGGWGGKLGTASVLGVLLYRRISMAFGTKTLVPPNENATAKKQI